MSAKNIIPRLKAFEQAFIHTKQKLNIASEIRYRLRFLRATFGDVLNVWPEYAQAEYYELARKLRQLENERASRGKLRLSQGNGG